MAYAITIVISVLLCSMFGHMMRFLGPQIRLVEVYIAFSLMMLTAGLGHLWTEEDLNTLELALSMACGALSMTGFCMSRSGIRGMGFIVPAEKKQLVSAIGLALLLGLANVVLANIWISTLSYLSIEHQMQGAVTAVLDSTSIDRSIWLLYICALAPLAEEILFRGFFWGALKPFLSNWSIIVITGICFGLIHFDFQNGSWTAVPPLCVFGMGLGWLRLKSGGIIAPLIAHAVNNIAVSLLLLQTTLA